MTSFQSDIAPMFAPFRCPMTWRFDLTNYVDVKTNADLILSMITSQQMPPTPFTPLSDAQIAVFQQWQSEGCPDHDGAAPPPVETANTPIR